MSVTGNFRTKIYTQRQPSQYSGDDVYAHLKTWSAIDTASIGRLAWIVSMPERKPIFYDQERRRWRRTRRVLEITGGFFTLVLVIFLVNVFRKPELPDILQAATHWRAARRFPRS